MIIYKTEMVEQKKFDKFICDRCQQEVEDELELQEAHNIKFVGGYLSVFGDMNNISCDLCQQCLKDLIGSFCIYNKKE